MEEKYVDQIIEILLKAGVIAKRYFGRKYEYSTKANASDFVTEVDVLLDTYLKNEIGLLFPKDSIVSEEGRNNVVDWTGRVWSIDPIDGTYDFLHGQFGWSIMVGLSIDGTPEFGIIYCPVYDMIYYGGESIGSWKKNMLTGKRDEILIKHVPLELSKITYSSNFEKYMKKEEKEYLYQVFPNSFEDKDKCFDRIFDGEAQGHVRWLHDCGPWDICAPAAILYAAGGNMYDEYGAIIDFRKRHENMGCIATDGFIDPILLDFVEDIICNNIHGK